MSNPMIEFITQEQVDRLTAHLRNRQPLKGKIISKQSTHSPIGGTLASHGGAWTGHEASHLLRRTMIGADKAQIEEAVALGLEGTVNTLLADQSTLDPPINYFYKDDPNTPIGETWIDKPFNQEFFGYQINSLHGWTIGNMFNEGMSIRERMTLFWHNHFVTGEVTLPVLSYQYIELLRNNALGNFRQLTKLITLNPSMLLYLNGNQSTKFAPNENYARELLELFTVGKGALAGEGDYTTFTEHDVIEAAKVLTGWRIRYSGDDGEVPQPNFKMFLHDATTKQLSARFGNAIIENADEEEYAQLIDIIFQSPHAATYICRKLYRWFVYYKIDEHVEADIIEPMAQLLRDNDFNIKPVLAALLSSEHFYDVNSVGCIIKNPIDFTVTVMKQFKVRFPSELTRRYQLWTGIFNVTTLLQMVYYQPPSVAGWKAFYQEPLFNQLWINSVTLVLRQFITDTISTAGFDSFEGRFRIDVFEFMDTIDDPLDPNAFIDEIAGLIYPNPLAQEQVDVLKEILIPGLPDFEWMFEYQKFLDNPNDEEIRATIETKIRFLLRAMLARPEYHLA